MTDMEKLTERLEKATKQLEVSTVMQNLMVMQLDGRLVVADETMLLYIEAITSVAKRKNAFLKHVFKKYFSSSE